MTEPSSTLDAATASVRAVPGVVATHDPRPPVARVVTVAAAALRIVEPASPHVLVEVEPHLTVSTAITTDIAGATPQIARAVADALREQHPLADEVVVQVRRIGSLAPGLLAD